MTALATMQREVLRDLLDGSRVLPRGLEVYRDSVRANHAAALAATYPAVRRLVGEAFFAEAARRYGDAHPSTSGDLNEYGARFADFLAAYSHAASLAYLPDVARLEWLCHECEQAPEAGAFDFAALAAVPPEAYGGLRFALHPAVRLLASSHPVVSIHAANAPERDGTVEGPWAAERALVHRAEGRAVVEACGSDDFDFLASLARGESLGEAATGADALARWVSRGIIAGFEPPACAR